MTDNRKEARSQHIYDRIYRAIVEQRLAPGTKLGEEALGEAFGTTRPRIRRTLLRLAHDRLVELRPNRGAYVAQPSVKEARDVFTVRRVLEPAALLSLPPLPAPRLRELHRFVAAEAEAQRRQDRQAAIRLSGEFHLRLARLTGNEVLHDLLRQMISRTSLIIAMYEIPGKAGCNCRHHEALLATIADHDPGAAAATMTTHLWEIEESLRLDRREAEPVDFGALFGPA